MNCGTNGLGVQYIHEVDVKEAVMKTIARLLLAVLLVIMATAMPASARGGHHYRGGGHVGIGLYMGPTWDPWWWGPPYYPYYPYYQTPPVIIRQEPEIYVQPNPQAEQPRYWYYCEEPKGYYPAVKKCPKGWMKVVPPEGEE
jgi:hypothetical protein